jgi:hypothetical protein
MWVPLSELKESNPIETAEYVKAMGIDDQPAFSWRVPHTLQHTRRILKAMKKIYLRTTQKYGIELPHTVERAHREDELNEAKASHPHLHGYKTLRLTEYMSQHARVVAMSMGL